MKFNKPLLACIMLVALATGCSFNAGKSEAEKNHSSAAMESTKTGSDQAALVLAPSSVLPAGPAVPNPYLQNTQKFSEQVEVNFRDAVSAMQQKNWDRAERVLRQLAEKNPKFSGVYLNLGIVYRNKGDTEKAAAEFNRAIDANPKNIDAYNQLAVLTREKGDFSTAETLYKKALAIWPYYPEGHKNLAILYDLYLAKPELALPHYQAYQQLLPAPDKQAESWIADLQRRLNGGKAPDKMEEK